MKKTFYFFFIFLLVYNAFTLLAHGEKKKSFTVVIDAGHGGKDTGAIANRVREKDVNLGVALHVRNIIQRQYPEVRVIMTRSDDTFIGLQQRANIANRNKADLFISIHSNSASSSAASGAETYVLGLWRTEDNLRVAMKENKSILLEKDYQVTYQGFDPSSTESYIIFEMLQNRHLDQSINLAQSVQNQLSRLPLDNRGVRQAGFLVIREIAMPGILIELGFLSNLRDARYLSSSTGQRNLAQAIVNGFGKYYEDFMRRSRGNTYANDIAERRKAGEQSLQTEEVTPDKDRKEPITEEQPLEEIDTVTTDIEEVSNPSIAQQPVAKPRAKDASSSSLTYKIQISASKKKMNTDDPWFRGLKVQRTKQGNLYIYTVDQTNSLAKARQLLKQRKRYFKDAYIVVYKGNKKVDTIYR